MAIVDEGIGPGSSDAVDEAWPPPPLAAMIDKDTDAAAAEINQHHAPEGATVDGSMRMGTMNRCVPLLIVIAIVIVTMNVSG